MLYFTTQSLTTGHAAGTVGTFDTLSEEGRRRLVSLKVLAPIAPVDIATLIPLSDATAAALEGAGVRTAESVLRMTREQVVALTGDENLRRQVKTALARIIQER